MKRINRYITLILSILFIGISGANAQNNIIRGRVVDKTTGEGVIGATVAEIDADDRVQGGTATDVNGDFVYTMDDPSNSLRVSIIGYNTKTLKPEFDTSMKIEIVSSDVEIEAVTVTAERRSSSGLTNIQERDKASSSVKVDLAEMQEVGVTSAADALQGKISGLDIISASGDPGSGSSLVIRGLGGMGNSEPLIVVDGIPQSKDLTSGVDISSADQEDISNMINIAVQDIVSIEVLKDAGATAIYGSQGADGVLLIETRKGSMGKVKFEYQYKHSINIQPDPIPMLNGDEYVTLQLEQLHNARGTFEVPREIAFDPDYEDFYNYSANTDWLDAITVTGITKDHYFALSGGGDKTRYSASFGYLDEGGTTLNTRSKQFSTRINLDYILSKKLMFSVLFSYNNRERDRIGNLKIDDKNIREMAYIKAPNMSIWEYDELGNKTGEYFNPITSYQGSGSSYYNPVAVANLSTYNEKNYDLETTFRFRYTFSEWMRFRQTISFQFTGAKTNIFLPYNALGVDWLNWQVNKAEESNNINSSIRSESQLIFDAPWDKNIHDLTGALSWITNQSEYEWMNLQSNRTPSVELQDPAVAAQINWIGSGSGQRRDLGAVANINYKYLDRYMLQYNVRADASSSFGSKNRWGVFNGVSLGWRFSSEEFMTGLDWLGDSKLRLSWGTSGRQPGDAYARFALYQTSGNYVGNTAITPSKIGLNLLKWENVETYNAGIDLSFFDNRFAVTADVYNKRTTDILFGGDAEWQYYKIPTSSGYSGLQYFNGGEMLNRGWELMLNATVFQKRDLFWSVYFNTSHNYNEFVSLPDNFNTEQSTSIVNGEYPKRIIAGQPIGTFFGFEYLGVYASTEDAIARDAEGNVILDAEGEPVPMTFKGTYTFEGGDAKYKDQNNDGKIDLNDVVPLGNSNPDFVGGFGTSFKYKNFDLSVGFHYRLGFDIVNKVAIQTEGMNDKNNQSKAVLNRWKKEGQSEPHMLPRAYENNPANNLGSDRYVERGDFLRLNNVKIGYQVPKHICDLLRVRRMSLALSARKLLTFTNYSGQDPEIAQNASDPFWIGVDEARTPPSRMTTISVSIFF
jgi:TonB-linked SusC/RagA family outer membrane protein